MCIYVTFILIFTSLNKYKCKCKCKYEYKCKCKCKCKYEYKCKCKCKYTKTNMLSCKYECKSVSVYRKVIVIIYTFTLTFGCVGRRLEMAPS